MTQGLKTITGVILVDPTTGVPAGLIGADGKEYLFTPMTANGPGAVAPSTYAPAAVAITGGTINGTTIGATTPTTVRVSELLCTFTDVSGTPGNVTNNAGRGRCAFAAAGSTVVVTNSLVAAGNTVIVQLGGSDATLTTVRVTTAAGSFTVTGNAAATGVTPFDYFLIG